MYLRDKLHVAGRGVVLGGGMMALLMGGAIAQDYALSSGAIGVEQVARGEEQFRTNCSGCHGVDLRSIDSNAPDLRGPAFNAGWVGFPLVDKFDTIRQTMPPGMAGSLGDQSYADIVAYILSVNGVEPSHDGELPANHAELAEIELTGVD